MPPPNVVLRSPVGLAMATSVLLGVAAATDAFALYAGVVRHRVTGDLLARSSDEINRADDLYDVAGTAQMVAVAAPAVVFIIWFHRVRSNADVFAQDVCTRSRGWAVGGWFVPLGNCWIPYTIAREIWTASAQRAPDGSWREVSAAPVKRWWVMWVTALVLLRVGSTMQNHAHSPAALQRATDVMFVCDLLMLTAAVLAIVFVRKLTAMQHTKAVQGPLATV
ncbi:DUF4328 domain-containing protein [Streptomyces sp. CBMA152]|uniref:DUF4328 domain-containing protein n=1 Tax=Streptomyces sp. CBMA152 TaxID=1896312 RepID=UPI0016604B15|nr:DUF4328 domain-containing protein [Streptomyces sp. CBMA152]MBD0741475.1 hypothetical protein [Streptomyces sp. CBMA152]